MQPHNQKNSSILNNAKVKDSGCKVIFDNNILCSQFLRDYIDLPHMKGIRPEDIEDVSAQFVPLVAEERNADRVKKVNIKGEQPLPADDIQAIVRDSPKQLVDVIADVLLAFLLKVNVPVSEAELLTDKVREKKVAELFADMEKLDIQAERRNTEEQRQRAEAAEQEAKMARQEAEATKQKIETSISLLIKSYQDAGMSCNSVLHMLVEKLNLDEKEAKVRIERYWIQTP